MIVYLNGEFLPSDQARVSVLDRGFIYGDGVYEVVPVYGRVPFRLPHHLARLRHSMEGIGLDNPHSDAQWEAIIARMVTEQDFDDQAVYFQVTRGVAKRDHAFPRNVMPTVFMMSNPLVTPSAQQIDRGVAVITAEDNRWQRCDLKTISLVGNVLMRELAAQAGAIETVMFRDGYLTEASASNVLVVIGGVIVAPPKNHHILPGITYDATAEFAAAAGIPFEVAPVTREQALAADEMWLSSSTKEVLAVTSVDGRPFARGVPGPLFRRMHGIFQERKRSPAATAAA
ncbi:MAG: D-amino acid aminotransferase [Pseudomonadota bacterium]|nr:D-amino acid aminotransferase [Pseudomonadota bacterium]